MRRRLSETAAAVKDRNGALLREDVARRAVVLRGLPEVVALHTTERCNLRCVMCPRSVAQGTRQLPRDRLAALCDALFPAARKVAVSAAAGEPMLADFDLVLERALEHGVRIDLVTNGTELTRERYVEAAPAFDHVNVSLDCHVAEVYERVRVGGRFARVEENLRGIAEERRRRGDDVLFSISAVVMTSTAPHLEGLIRYARSLDADGVILQPLSHAAKPTPEEDLERSDGPGATRAALERAKTAAREVGQNVYFAEFGDAPVVASPPRDKFPAPLEGRGQCWYLVQQFGVQPTGDAYPCCHPTDYRIGNVIDEEPVALWNGVVMRRLRAAHYRARPTLFCSGCPQAPHLPALRPARLFDWWREGRMRRHRGRDGGAPPPARPRRHARNEGRGASS